MLIWLSPISRNRQLGDSNISTLLLNWGLPFPLFQRLPSIWISLFYSSVCARINSETLAYFLNYPNSCFRMSKWCTCCWLKLARVRSRHLKIIEALACPLSISFQLLAYFFVIGFTKIHWWYVFGCMKSV